MVGDEFGHVHHESDAAIAALAAIVQGQRVRDGIHAFVGVLRRMLGDLGDELQGRSAVTGAGLLDGFEHRLVLLVRCFRGRDVCRWRRRVDRRAGAGGRGGVQQEFRVRSPRRARALDRRHDQSAERAHRPQAGIDRAVLGRVCLFVPAREDHGAAAAAALAPRLFGAGERDLG
jgi:hypothetical protein